MQRKPSLLSVRIIPKQVYRRLWSQKPNEVHTGLKNKIWTLEKKTLRWLINMRTDGDLGKEERESHNWKAKSSDSFRFPSSCFLLPFYYYNFCVTVAGPLVTSLLRVLRKSLLIAVRQETHSFFCPFPPQSSTMPHKISDHRLKQTDLKVQKAQAIPAIQNNFNLFKMENQRGHIKTAS